MSQTQVDCSGLTKEDVLTHLYNNAKPLGMGFIQAKAEPMSIQEAKSQLSENSYFDYLNGRPLKISFSSYPIIDSHLYDRDQGGPGTMKRLVGELKSGSVVSQDVKFEPKSDAELKEILKNSKIEIVSFAANDDSKMD